MASDDGDEISLDFSKVTKWFKGEKAEGAQGLPKDTEPAEAKTPQSPAEGKEEDLSLDISSLTKPFSKLFSAKKAEAHGHIRIEDDSKDEGISISWDGIKKFLITYQLLFLLLVPMYIAYDLRIQTVDLPITEQWARDTINNNYRSAILGQVARQYPNLPEAQRNELVNEQLDQLLSQQKDAVEAQIKNQAAYFKSRFNDEHGHTVLLDIDSYSYFRETRNLLTYGHDGNTLVNGTNWDTYILAPLGVPAGKNLHNHLGVWQYKIWKVFDKDIYLMKSFFYLPMIIYVLAIIPAFMIATYYGGAFGGIVAGIIVAVHPSVLTRTSAGVTDTDVYQIFFPLWVVWLYLEAFRRKTLTGKLVMGSLAGIALGFYSLSWSGWWLIFYFLFITTLAHVISQVYHHKQGNKINLTVSWAHIKPTLYTLGLFLLFTGIFVTLLRDFRFFLGFITEPFAFLALKKAANPNLWPNVYTTVAELNPISMSGAISQISFGSNLLFGLACLGILLTLTKKDEEGRLDVKLFVLLAMWFISTIWASKSGVRFVGLAVPAFGLALGAAFGIITVQGSAWLKKHMKVPELLSKCVLIVLLAMMLIAPVKAGYSTAERNIPLISDSWWQTLTQIKDQSQPNAIVTSWWDFGHWFKSIADRPTTFDGGTQNTPIAHWVGKILLTSDEDQAIGILRMLDCGSYQVTRELEAEGLPTIDAVNLLYSTFNMTREEARKEFVAHNVKYPDAVLGYTHCEPPEAFLITSADMVGKSGVWAHFGSWDFNRADIWLDRNNGTFQERVSEIISRGFSKTEAENLQREVMSMRDEGEANSWIAPWPSYGGGASCAKQDDTLTCQNGLIVNLTNMSVVFTGDTSPVHGLVYIDGDDVQQKTYLKYSQDISMALVPAGEGYNAVFMQYPLGMSMFTRLFYLEGHGLRHFKRFSDKTSVLGERIVNWKVDWTGNETNIYYHINITSPPQAMEALPGSNSSEAKPEETVQEEGEAAGETEPPGSSEEADDQ